MNALEDDLSAGANSSRRSPSGSRPNGLATGRAASDSTRSDARIAGIPAPIEGLSVVVWVFDLLDVASRFLPAGSARRRRYRATRLPGRAVDVVWPLPSPRGSASSGRPVQGPVDIVWPLPWPYRRGDRLGQGDLSEHAGRALERRCLTRRGCRVRRPRSRWRYRPILCGGALRAIQRRAVRRSLPTTGPRVPYGRRAERPKQANTGRTHRRGGRRRVSYGTPSVAVGSAPVI